MTSPIQCIRTKAKAGKINQKFLREIDEILEGLGNEGDDILRARTLREVVEYRLNMQKKQTALQIRKIQEIEELDANPATKKSYNIFGAKVKGTTLAMMSRLSFDPTGTFTGSNVEITWKRILGEAHSLFSEGLQRFSTKKLGFSQDKAGLRNLVRELFGENSGDASAKLISDAWKRTDEHLVRQMQRHGGIIFKRQDWGLPQRHDSLRVGRVTPEEWIDDIMPRLDREKMIDDLTGKPFTDERLVETLHEVYETITSHGLNKLTPGGPRIGRKLANRHMDARFLIFRNADDWMGYDEQFGTGGDIFELLTGHMDQMSREIALLEVLGPNPDATIKNMTDRIKKNQSQSKGKFQSVKDVSGSLMVEKMYDTLTGRLNAPATAWWAEANQFNRNILTSAQLGGAFFAALTDMNFSRLTAQFNGLNATRTQQNTLKNFFSTATGKQERLRIATKLRLGAEQWAGTAIGQQRFLGEVTGPKTSRRISDSVLRGTLLTPWTYAGRHGIKQEVLMSVADRMNRQWSSLEPEYRRGLERYNVTKEDWDVIRKPENFIKEDGVRYFYATAATQNGYEEAAKKIMNFAFTEAEYAVPSASTLTQALLSGGMQSGTFWGEMARNVGLYKSFPLTVILTHVMRGTVYTGITPASKIRYMLDMVITTTLFGGMVLQMKQIQKGKDPVSVLNWDSGPEFLAAAMLQGGGLGIFGDFLFADQNRFGFGPLQTLAGPVLGSEFPDLMKLSVGNLQELAYGEDTNSGRELTKFLQRYTPGASIWYGRLALERLLFERMQDILDPNANRNFREKHKRAQTDYGQDWWWAPGNTSPERRPDIGAIVE